MLKVNCNYCKKELNKPGALVFSPPFSKSGEVFKIHLCEVCWEIFRKILHGE